MEKINNELLNSQLNNENLNEIKGGERPPEECPRCRRAWIHCVCSGPHTPNEGGLDIEIGIEQ